MGQYRRKCVSEKSIGRCKRSSTALRQSLENKVRKAVLYSDLLTTHPWAQMVQFSHATVPLMIGKTLHIYIYTGVVGGEKRKEKETPGPPCGNTHYSFLLHIQLYICRLRIMFVLYAYYCQKLCTAYCNTVQTS